MSWSLSEVRSLVVKAGYGAGLSWGLAEEAGYAVCWLESSGLPGVKSMVTSLTGQSKTSARERFSLATGVYLSESNAGPPRVLGVLDEPLILLPFLARLSNASATQLSSDSCQITMSSQSISLDLTRYDNRRTADSWHWLESSTSRATAQLGDFQPSTHSRVSSNRAEWITQLETLASKTYAPETEESKLIGAGAGLSDND